MRNAIETLADAVGAAVDGSYAWSRRAAEKALKALRNPNEVMMAAALKGQADTPEARKAIKLQWRRMIDAAAKAGDADGVIWSGLEGESLYDACEKRWPKGFVRPSRRRHV